MRSNRKPVAPIITRDPIPETRDPVAIVQGEPTHRQQPVIVRVEVPRCRECGHTVFRNGGTSLPNISTMEMLRYRKCGKCGASFYFAWPMTPEQVDKYRAE
jgi:DNA-directed RNA polymerase subunit RPC12/RpoP